MALQLWDRGRAKRVAAVQAYQFPGAVRQRFAFAHPGVSADHIATVEAAVRQWLRLHAREPAARLTMPSAAAEAMWRELILHTKDPGPASAADPGTGLAAAYRLALADEPVETPRLPLLFRVDREIGITGARLYLADCGGRGQCFGSPGGARCLEHIAGPGRAKRRWRGPGDPLYPGGTRITETSGCGGT